MKRTRPSTLRTPPRLTMDEYAEFVSETVRHLTPERIAWQKEMEERITAPFRIRSDGAMPRPGSLHVAHGNV